VKIQNQDDAMSASASFGSLQMMTALRPIIGKADTFFPTEKKFFVSHWFDCLNAKP
jgi:hypothetical protein